MSHRATKVPEETKEEEAPLERSELSLSEVAELVASPRKFRKLFNPGEEWRRYFQSPVDKAAHSIKADHHTEGGVKFNNLGALQEDEEARKFLLKWLGVREDGNKDEATREAIGEWLNKGSVLPEATIDKIAEKLKKETLPNQALYNQPICRLVRRDQLRYDPDYQIIYQMTPGSCPARSRKPRRGAAMPEKLKGKTDEEQQLKGIDRKIYGEIEYLGCLDSMKDYYQLIFKSIYHLVGHERFSDTRNLAHMSREHVRALRRYVNADLNNLSIEFYLQRVGLAGKCRDERKQKKHLKDAVKNPAHHPCAMRGGFSNIVEGGEYSYEEFLGETLPIFVAIHSHLVSINRELGSLYYYATEAPFSSFTPTGKSEIRNLTRQLNRIMRGLLIATHLQPQSRDQYDLINYLISCRADCQHFFETIPRYYQTHRMRLAVFPIDPPVGDVNRTGRPPELEPKVFPVTCLPWSAGVYLDFLAAYEDIALHVMAVLVWAVRLFSIWYFVPRRYLRLVAPMGPIYGKH